MMQTLPMTLTALPQRSLRPKRIKNLTDRKIKGSEFIRGEAAVRRRWSRPDSESL